MEVGLLAAFLGGTLALVSPCGALLLPAFFASTFGTGTRLAVHAAVFYTGLLVLLVPFGLGVGALGTILATHRSTIVVVTSLVLIVLGALQAWGLGLDLSRLLPGASRLHQQAAGRTGVTRTFVLGAASGVVGVCTGPILGAVLTLAAAQGQVASAGVMLAVYGAGMVVPLVALVATWDRLGLRGRTLLRGRTFTWLGRTWHTTSVTTGVLIMVLGVVFWATNGLVRFPELLPIGVQTRLQGWVSTLTGRTVDIAAILVTVATALTVWWVVRRRADGSTTHADSPQERPDPPVGGRPDPPVGERPDPPVGERTGRGR